MLFLHLGIQAVDRERVSVDDLVNGLRSEAPLGHEAGRLGHRKWIRYTPIAGGINDQPFRTVAFNDGGHSFAAHLGVGIDRKRAPVSAVANLADGFFLVVVDNAARRIEPVFLQYIHGSQCSGLLAVRQEDGGELLDPTVSKAFAVADHQIAHVYVSDLGLLPKVREVLEGLPGIEPIYDATDKHVLNLDHPRSGELVALADARSWFTYYYWTDDRRAPDFARTVEIHRKPGYDPVELFLDPGISLPKFAIGKRLLLRKLGFAC